MSSLSSRLTAKGLRVGAATGGGVVGGTFTGTGDPGLSRAQHMLTTYVDPPNVIRTTGYDTNSDMGGGLYVRVTSEPSHFGKFMTQDGTWYELKHDGIVWAAQMGAKPTVTAWNAKENSISDALNAAVDYIVFNRFGPCDLHIHGNTYYMDKTVQLKGNFNVRGSAGKGGTFIMPDNYVTGFVAHHPYFSFEAFGTLYFNNRDWELGETMYTSGGIPGTPSAHAYVCTQAGRSSADGSGKPTGTGTGYVDGGVKWDYLREASRVELLVLGYAGEFSNISLYSHFDGTYLPGFGVTAPQTQAVAIGPWPQFPGPFPYSGGPWKPAFGFLGRVRAHVHHCDMNGFSAHGCAFIANGDFDFPTITGNVNFWAVTDCAFYYNCMDGLHASYSDGNAGYAAHIDVSMNGRWGIRDQSFLGNVYVQVQSAFDGRSSLSFNKRFPASVIYNGRRYFAKLGRIGAGPVPDMSVPPSGTSASTYEWSFGGGDGTWITDGWDYPDWVDGHHYEASGSYGSDNINARNMWLSTYIEGGTWPAQWNAKDIVMGGITSEAFIGQGENLLNDGNWYNPVNYKSRSHAFNAAFGSGGQYSQGEGLLYWTDGVKDYSLRTDSYGSDGVNYATDNWAWCINNFRTALWLKGGQTSRFYGKPSPADEGTWAINQLIFGSDGDGRQHDYFDAAPTGGAHGRGEVVWNRLATTGQPMGWMCTVAGTPGTWRPLPNVT